LEPDTKIQKTLAPAHNLTPSIGYDYHGNEFQYCTKSRFYSIISIVIARFHYGENWRYKK
jgi:hypothetical protein